MTDRGETSKRKTVTIFWVLFVELCVGFDAGIRPILFLVGDKTKFSSDICLGSCKMLTEGTHRGRELTLEQGRSLEFWKLLLSSYKSEGPSFP